MLIIFAAAFLPFLFLSFLFAAMLILHAAIAYPLLMPHTLTLMPL